MSEDFDREAEKERLREKLEGDQERREATEHMSDLLLKGATMTNRHCDACGDPVFRYDGQEFCPTCGETVDEDGNADVDADASAEGATTDDGGTASGAAASETGEASAGERTGEEADTSASGEEAGAAGEAPDWNAGGIDAGPSPERGDPSRARMGTRRDQAPSAPAAGRDPAPERSPRADDLGEARASLVRTLADLAARAERAEDVRRTRDLLAAAREAAEAIAALDRAGR